MVSRIISNKVINSRIGCNLNQLPQTLPRGNKHHAQCNNNKLLHPQVILNLNSNNNTNSKHSSNSSGHNNNNNNLTNSLTNNLSNKYPLNMDNQLLQNHTNNQPYLVANTQANGISQITIVLLKLVIGEMKEQLIQSLQLQVGVSKDHLNLQNLRVLMQIKRDHRNHPLIMTMVGPWLNLQNHHRKSIDPLNHLLIITRVRRPERNHDNQR